MRPEPAHFKHWPAGVERQARVPRLTLPAALAASAAQCPDKAAIIFNDATTTYAQLQQRAWALAGFLQQRLGVKPGDQVLVFSQNSPQWVVACYAIWRAGAVVVPVSAMSTRAEVAYLAADSQARFAFVAQELLPQLPLGLDPAEIGAAIVIADADAKAAAANANNALHDFEAAIVGGLQPAPLPTDPDALAVLPYTSGTTGRPKGCMHSHATVIASLAASAVWKRLHQGSVVLTVAPLFHMLGLQNGMNLPILLGATAVMMPRWHAATAAALIERHRVSAWSAPPAMVLDLFVALDAQSHDLSSLVFLSGGGAAMPEAVAAMLKQRHGLNYEEAYGLTETASFLHANPPQRCKPQCLGIPTQGVDSRIVDPDTLQELPHGEVGELLTHAPQVMRGYWRNTAADQAAFVTLDGLRFLRTGDLALVDEDGYFFLKDRLKRMVNVSGYKVWPAEVENALYAHPAVFEACVIAVPDRREGRSGEAVKALVVLKAGPVAQALSADDFIAWCRQQMAAYKVPRSVEFVRSLPKSGTGKILWRELQQAHQMPESPTP